MPSPPFVAARTARDRRANHVAERDDQGPGDISRGSWFSPRRILSLPRQGFTYFLCRGSVSLPRTAGFFLISLFQFIFYFNFKQDANVCAMQLYHFKQDSRFKLQDSNKMQTFVPYNYLITWRSLNFIITVNKLFVVFIVFSTWIDELPQYESRQFFLKFSDARFW